MNISTLVPKRTNCYLIETEAGKILVDTDEPQTLYTLLRLFKEHSVAANQIRYLVVTHFHPDHDGCVQDLKELGVTLLLHEVQEPYVQAGNDFFHKSRNYEFRDIRLDDNLVVSSAESRRLLAELGIQGELISTPGHSPDSISLVMDGCCAFTGDLPDFPIIEAFEEPIYRESWDRILGFDVRQSYPGHNRSFAL